MDLTVFRAGANIGKVQLWHEAGSSALLLLSWEYAMRLSFERLESRENPSPGGPELIDPINPGPNPLPIVVTPIIPPIVPPVVPSPW